jgi:hypothetical protein
LREAEHAARFPLRALYAGVYVLEHLSARLSSVAVAVGPGKVGSVGNSFMTRFSARCSLAYPTLNCVW